MLSVKALAEALNVHENTIYNLVKQGMPYLKVGRDYRFDLEEVKQWLRENNK